MEPGLEFNEYDTRLGAYAVIVRDDHVLLALWNEPAVPMWTLPGGGVDLAESPGEGAVREVREETGYDVELGALLGVDTFVMAPEERPEPVGDRPQKNVRRAEQRGGRVDRRSAVDPVGGRAVPGA